MGYEAEGQVGPWSTLRSSTDQSHLVLERLMAALRAELDAEVVLGGAANGTGSTTIDIPLACGDMTSIRSLRIRPRDDRPLDDSDLRVIAALTSLIADELKARDRGRATRWRAAERIHTVLRRGALRIVFQPIADLYTGQVVGVEALSRFPSQPRRDPACWFKEALAVGLAPQLEAFAVAQAVRALPSLPGDVYLSVNLSPAVLACEEVAAVFEQVDGSRLVVEITEHAEVEDYDALNSAIADLRSQGLRIAVDDAGSGFASMRHVLRLAPDIIKLDLSLTHGIDNDSTLRALGFSLRSFASAIDAQVIAEGVETAEELEALRFLGVPYGQGFYLSSPSPLEEHEWLAEYRLATNAIG